MAGAAGAPAQIAGCNELLVRDYLHSAANIAGTATAEFHHTLLGVLALQSKTRSAK